VLANVEVEMKPQMLPGTRAMTATLFLFALGCFGVTSKPAADAEAADKRRAVALPADGQQAVLHEMRSMLGAMGATMGAAVKGDTAALFAAVAPAGTAAAADPALESMLPAEWKELAERTHAAFDTLAIAARQSRTPQALKDTVLVRLSQVTGSCTACHEMFRVTVR
jgi:cytochrome c556